MSSETKTKSQPLPAEETLQEERGHHPDSGSGLQIKEWCERFVNKNEDSEASLAGTACHTACETGNLEGLSEQQMWGVELCLNEVIALRETLVEEYGSDDVIELQEIYGTIDDETHPSGAHGTSGGYLDKAFIFNNETEGELIDYKFVQWAVEPAENNLQVYDYILVLRKLYPRLEKIRARLFMPYLGQIEEHTFTSEDFPRMYARIKALVARRNGPNPREVPSWATCSWCGRIGECESIRNVLAKPAAKFAKLEIPEGWDPMKVTTQAEAALAIRIADVAKLWGQGIRSMITDKATTDPDFTPEGYKLLKATKRKVVSVAKLCRVLLRFGVPEKDIDEAKTLTMGASEKLVKAVSERGQKEKNAEAAMAAAMQEGALEEEGTIISLRADRQAARDK